MDKGSRRTIQAKIVLFFFFLFCFFSVYVDLLEPRETVPMYGLYVRVHSTC